SVLSVLSTTRLYTFSLHDALPIFHQANNSLWLKEDGATPLLRAALCGDLTVVQLLLARGADPSIPTFDQTTPLMVASGVGWAEGDRKSTRLNSSHGSISYAVFCLK